MVFLPRTTKEKAISRLHVDYTDFLPWSPSCSRLGVPLVDDTMLMEISSTKEARAFKKILDDFMEASCTSINHLKSQIFVL